MATSPNYGWLEPDNTDLVKNGALAIRTLGNAIDTTMATMTPKSLVDAKGDLIAASADNTPARLAVGSNGETLVADSSTSTGLRYTQAGVNNPIINSGVEIWQRGTADVTLTAAAFTYWADRWFGARSAGTSGAKVKYVAASTLAGLPNAFRIQRDSGNTSTNDLYACYDLETKDSVRYAGQTVTLSFYARAGANYSPTSSQVNVKLTSGTGTDQGGYATTWTGSSSFISTNQAITTSWVRYSFTGSVASSANQLGLILTITPTGTAGADDYADFTGFQIDLGSVAQPYRRAMGTIQGELSACQRYFEVVLNDTVSGVFYSTSAAYCIAKFDVTKRTSPTMTYPATLTNGLYEVGTAFRTPTALSNESVGLDQAGFTATGMSSGTIGKPLRGTFGVTITASAEL
jgi:hypothetical protein